MSAQTERRDSIQASVITAYKGNVRVVGTHLFKPTEFTHMAAAVGSADAIKYVQTLPGVSTGAEGSSSFYARGGNLGNNVITLDGVPVYGGSHLLGFSTVYPQDIISDIRFQIGGFTSEEGNLTSSHMSLASKTGSFDDFSADFSASNFMLGSVVSAPLVKDKVSVLVSLRLSPVGSELSAIKNLTSAMDSISNIKAAVYDAYGKLSWKIDKKQNLSLSLFNSLDSYGYRFGGTFDERMRWSNAIAMLSHDLAISERMDLHTAVSYNRFMNYQGMHVVLGDKDNDLAMLSKTKETTALSTVSGSAGIFNWQTGVKYKHADFSPGSSSGYADNIMSPVDEVAAADVVSSNLITLHGQAELVRKDKFFFRTAGRLNSFSSQRQASRMDDHNYFDAECSLLARLFLFKGVGVEATADWTTQYYHTLEGIPLGWSLDMMIPSDAKIAPEKARQYYAGVFMESSHHRFSLGAYTKYMDNLIWFTDATQIFNSSVAGWRDGIRLGSGTSRGAELMYDMEYDKTRMRLAYTLSKTDRLFEGVNDGLPFPAKYDRRHILNISAERVIKRSEQSELGVNTLFTYQSGNWETISTGRNPGTLLGNLGSVSIDYFTTINNWELPSYIRWDLSVYWNYGINSRHPGTLNVGIYNVLNRHNTYSITFDTDEKKWKQMSIFPIMPSISWTMTL